MASRPLRPDSPLASHEIAAVQRTLSRLERDAIEEDALYLEDDLYEFVRAAWPIIEPAKKFVPGWHQEAIAEHLEAAMRAEIDLLLISMPPGHMKTLLCSVAFPAWVWCKRPGMRMLTACYSKDFAERDAMSSRMIIESPWYQARWPLRLRRDTNRKDRYENSERGYRVTTTVGGRSTGEGGGLLIGDDLLSMADIHSPAKRAEVIHLLTDVWPTRLRDEEPGATIIVGQRGHDMDPIGYLLAEQLPGTVHLNLPARYDPANTKPTKWWTDPRTKKGQALWPALYPERRLRKLESRMSADGAAAQLQQTPTVGGGSILPRKHWRIWTEWMLPPCAYYILSVDPSVKDGQHNDPWACQVWGLFEHVEPLAEGRLTGKPDTHWCMILLTAWGGHLSYPEAKAKVLQTHADWTIDDDPPDSVLIEDKAAGPFLIAEFERMGLDGVVAYDPGDRNKAARADRVSDILYHGRVWVPGRKMKDGTRSDIVIPPWAEMVVAQCATFPAGAEDDQVDAMTQALKHAREIGYIDLDTDMRGMQHSNATTDDGRRRESAYG